MTTQEWIFATYNQTIKCKKLNITYPIIKMDEAKK
jgi:hypothetical protein